MYGLNRQSTETGISPKEFLPNETFVKGIFAKCYTRRTLYDEIVLLGDCQVEIESVHSAAPEAWRGSGAYVVAIRLCLCGVLLSARFTLVEKNL